MKKARIYILLALGASLLSCVKSETVTQEESANVPIFFDTDADEGYLAGTKSIINSTDELKAGYKLKVYDRHSIGNLSALYIDGLEYTYGTEGWTSNPTQYWTKEGLHQFTVHNTPQTGSSTPNIFFNTFFNKLSINQWTLDNKFDFLYAHASRDMAAPNPHVPVPLQMKHLLSAVQFNIKDMIYKTDGYSTKIEFNNIEISSIRNRANVEIQFEKEPKITLQSSLQNVTSPRTATELTYATPYNIFGGTKYGSDGNLLFFPQPKDVFANVEATIHYTELFWDRYNGRWRRTEKTKTLKLAEQGSTNNWQSGKKYIYTFLILDDKISFEVKVVPWVMDDVILDE